MLKKTLTLPAIFAMAFLITACSGEESITEKASQQVDAVTTKAADKAVKQIRTPLNKARLTKTMGDDRTKAMEEALRNK